MISNLKDKNIIITGASEGLGKLIAIELSKVVSKIILVSSSEKKLKLLLNKCYNKKKHLVCPIDFNDINNVSLKLSQCVKHFDSIDAVLHIAGGGFGVKEYAPSRDDYMKVFNINLFSIFEINRIIIPIMKKKKKGVLFHVGSIASNESVGSLSYNIAKSSISTYVRSLSKPLAKYNICVSGISPGGFIYSKNSMNRLKTNNNKAYNQFIAKRLPLKRMPKAEELLPIIKVIIENHMMFTGSMISCDAGEGNFYKEFY